MTEDGDSMTETAAPLDGRTDRDAAEMMQVLRDLTPLDRVVCSSDYDRTIEYLKERFPVTEIAYGPGVEHNGWVIPPKWDVLESRIEKDGELVYDGKWHPIATIALSAPFEGTVDREELRRHLHYDHRYEDAVPFHFRQLFRSWDRDWGFCVPKRLYDALEPGEYQVTIRTREEPGVLRMLEWEIPGEIEEAIVFGTNLDHPGVSNDGLSGVVVGLELFRRLARRPRRLSYRLVLAQGIIGNEYYLGLQDAERRSKLLAGVMLEMIGSPTQLALQFSRAGDSPIELAIADVLRSKGVDHRTGAFEEVVLNDEYIWEAYGVPMAALTRFPYREYHTHWDSVELMREELLLEAVDVLEAAVEQVEATPLIFKRFEGNVCLSNPRFDLYVDPGQVAFGDAPDPRRKKLRLLMDTIPSLRRPVTVRQLARQVGLDEPTVEEYVRSWAEKGLLELRP